MHLFDLAQFGLRFGVDTTVPDFMAAVSEASKAATADLAARLRFRTFDEYPLRRDFFFIRRVFDDGVGGFNLPLLLQHGLLRQGSVEVWSAPSLPALKAKEGLDVLSLDGGSRCVIDSEGGVILVTGVDLRNSYLMVEYDGGLPVASDGAYEGVPMWLSEAAMTQAALFLSRNRQFAPEGGEDLSELQDAARRAFSGHVRYYPAAAQPMLSETL